MSCSDRNTRELAWHESPDSHAATAVEQQLIADLKIATETYKNPVFTTALIAGDDVLLHAIHKAGLMDKVRCGIAGNRILAAPLTEDG